MLRRAGLGTRRFARLPLPPLEMRELVGPTDPSLYDNLKGSLVYAGLPPRAYERVLDIGCGCGRVARQLIQQIPQPREYVGIDLHRGMIRWCNTNLKPHARGFGFHHHDVFNAGLNPGAGKPAILPLPESASGERFSLVIATSVFTHMVELQAEHYMHETRRVLSPEGIVHSTWLLFDKSDFPIMQEFQNALFINDVDPSNAVIYDRQWLRRTAADADLAIYSVTPPPIRGYQWTVRMTPWREGVTEVPFPEDTAPRGDARPPVPGGGVDRIGLDDSG